LLVFHPSRCRSSGCPLVLVGQTTKHTVSPLALEAVEDWQRSEIDDWRVGREEPLPG
jgi:hypothetical protein